MPFVYSDTVAFVIELGTYYARFYSNGMRVMGPDGEPLEIDTPWLSEELPGLQWAQVGSVLTITHPSHRPQELQRFESGMWLLYPVDWYRVPTTWIAPPTQWGHLTTDPMPFDSTLDVLFLPDASHPALDWKWLVSANVRVLWGNQWSRAYETRPKLLTHWLDHNDNAIQQDLTENMKIVIAPDRPITIRRKPNGVIRGAETWFVESYNFYRGRGGVFGFVGLAPWTQLDFIDEGKEPNFMLPPLKPAVWDMFLLFPDQATNLPGNGYSYPATVAFFEERRVWGGRPYDPCTIYASATGDYYDFEPRTISSPGMPLVFELASRKRERIRSMVTLDKLLVFTDASVWSVGGTQGPLDFDNVQTRVVDEVGSTSLHPIVVNGRVLYVRTKGTGVRILTPSPEANTITPSDASGHAQHLFASSSGPKAIVDWTFAEDPWGVIWAARSDGTLLSATLSGDTLGWSRHSTDGRVISVASIPEATEDAVYLAVERNGAVFVERMESRVLTGGTNDSFSLDAAIVFGLFTYETHIGGLAHLEGYEVFVVAKNNPVIGPLTVTNGAVTVPSMEPNNWENEGGPQTVGYVGLPFECSIETLDVPGSEALTKQKQVVSIGFEVDKTKGLWVGQDFEHLTEWRQRNVTDRYNAISAATELVKVAVSGSWSQSARAVLMQKDPFPVTVLGITREVDVGG